MRAALTDKIMPADRRAAKTYITQGMRDLIDEGVARLAGASTQAVFHLKQAMGGGKTHLLYQRFPADSGPLSVDGQEVPSRRSA